MLQAITWLLVIEFIGLLALPATFAFFPYLPDRGYSLTKVFGLLVGGFVIWFLGMLGLPFAAPVCWVLLIILFAGLAFWLLRRKQGKLLGEVDLFFRGRVGLIIVLELLFIVAYFYLVNMRSFMPEIRDQEKFGDFAFFNSMVLHPKLPPTDPWMSGYSINYYYFSHFLMAMLAKMSGVAPAVAFNLTVPLVFGLTAIAGFGLVYNLVSSVVVNRPSSKASAFSPAILAGLLAAAGLVLLGNLEAARQVLFPAAGQAQLGNYSFNWWSPSRVVQDFMPQPIGNGLFSYKLTETITEFPMFSFLLADMHPHVMTLPFVILVIAAAFNLLRAPVGSLMLNLRRAEGGYFFVILALAVGGLYFLNALDFPTFLLLVILAALLRELRSGAREVSTKLADKASEDWKVVLLGGRLRARESGLDRWRFGRWLGFSVRLGLASVLLYLPFHLNFTSFIGDNYVPDAVNIPLLSSLAKSFLLVAWDRTPLLVQSVVQEDGQTVQRWGYLMVFGLFLYPVLCLLALKLWPYLKNPYAYLDEKASVNGAEKASEGERDGEKENSQAEAEVEQAKTMRPGIIPNALGYYVTGFGLIVLLLSQLLSIIHLNPVTTLLVGLAAAPLTAIGVGLLAYEYLGRMRAQKPARELLIGLGLSAFLMIALGWLLHFELYGPLLLIVITAALLILFENRSRPETSLRAGLSLSQADQFALLLIALPALLTFVIEIVFLRDIFNARLNTIFKFYYQAWVMYALAAAYASWRVVAWGWKLAPFEQTQDADTGESKNLSETASNVPERKAPLFQPQASLNLGLAGMSGGNPNIAFRSYAAPLILEPAPTQVLEDLPAEDEEAQAAEDYARQGSRRVWWRWPFALGLTLLLLAGLVYPLFAPYEKSGHFKERKGLDGEQWLSQSYPEDYSAILWLRNQASQNASFEGPILETAGPDWFDYNRVGSFSGFPVLMGWPGHELQWRGGKASTREEVSRRIQDVDTIYSTTDNEEARRLLQKYGLKFVFVGTLETGARDGRWYNGQGQIVKKNYPPEALAKFASFMKPVYQQNGVTIYSF